MYFKLKNRNVSILLKDELSERDNLIDNITDANESKLNDSQYEKALSTISTV